MNVTPSRARMGRTVTLEFSNTTPLPAKIMQMKVLHNFYFLKEMMICELSYADRKGKYMFQKGVTLPKL